MPYYELLPYFSEDEDTAILDAGPNLPDEFTNWLSPNPWDIPVPEPLDIVVSSPGVMLLYYDNPMPLITEDLLKVMRDSGVDNIMDYSTRITDSFSGKVFENYRAIKIIGAIEAIDEELSDSDDLDELGLGVIDKFYDEIVIDENKTHGQHMFRLAEKCSCIAVSKAVRDSLLSNVSSKDILFEPLFLEEG